MQGLPLFEGTRAFLEQLTTTRGRLAMSALVAVVTLVVAGLLVPAIARWLRRLVRSRFVSGWVSEGLAVLSEYLPTSGAELVARTLQLVVAAGSLIALLVVWGMTDVAVTVLLGLLAAVPDLFRAAVTAALVLLALVGSDQLGRLVAGFSDEADRVTEHQQEILLRVGQVALFTTVGVMVLGLWGVQLAGLLVGAGFLGIVVGLAARQTLGSMIAGFVLMFSRPFTIGDWVQIGENEGIVTDITVFNTRLENFDGEFVVIPNDAVGDRAVTNRSRKGTLRLRTDVGIDYGTDVERASEVAREAMEDVDAVVASPPPQVVPKAFGDSSIVLELRYWIDHPTPPRKWRTVSAVVQRVKERFDGAGVTIPFPQRQLSDRAGAPDPDSMIEGVQVGTDGDTTPADGADADGNVAGRRE